jgi:hypothetical protein
MPPGGLKLLRLYPAETDEQHKEQQDGLGLAADNLQYGACCMYGWYLHIDKVCSGSGYHAYHKHPVFKESDESAFHTGYKDNYPERIKNASDILFV